ncbi:c-type cytochrome biogenesis protein CcmI [Actinocorallia sp. B10E7]|uniref:c-type cytochrome biogenesis protein CcmI n=1 Tax=Actinocorallia sp. B10E7 TaxID=3153558 RepID=UPI00325DE5A9
MGLISGLLTFPLAPVRGVVWLAERIQEEAERQMYDPATVRRRLSEIDRSRASGELSEEEAADLQNELLSRMISGRSGGPP